MKLLSQLFISRRSKIIIILGFCAVFLLIAGVMFVSFKQLNRFAYKQDQIERNTRLKESWLISIQNIIREQTLSMFALSLLQDPFAKDEEYMRFNAMAGEITEQRLKFETIQLSGEEQRALERVKTAIGRTASLQGRIVDGVVNSEVVDVEWFMDHEAPLEMELLSIFSDLGNAIRQAGHNSLLQIQSDYRQTYWSIVMLAIAAIVLFVLIVRFVIGQIGRTEFSLSSEKEQLEVTLKSIGDAVITVNENSSVTYLNPVAEHMTAWSNDLARGRHLSEIYRTFREDTGERIQHPACAGQLDAQVVGVHRYSVLKTHDGQEYIIEDNTSPIYNKRNYLIGKVVVFRDMSHARKIERQLSWQAKHDPLTGLANRLDFETHLQEFVDNAIRYDNEHILLYLDLDKFKAVNDLCGHSAGDSLLQGISLTMEQCVRRSDVLARLGGDEFGILLNSCDAAQGHEIAENIRRRVNNYNFSWQGRTHRVGVSIGMMPINSHSRPSTELLHLADIACYSAKAHGKNCIRSYERLVSGVLPVYSQH